ncbi:hypothetical protein PGT21_005751 [Puccinia graminis f. sp. tritici]|uniref:Uncharacterized protein n=1 Tax=Puccinia graminis f. sp. tritici TaxID=56615 RepID=A0A5B0LR16_PUCGR|nr:hypothetical protein PGT21_005751 [Puccinia graminis f. sp. tritici]KAA1137770.1 hypothetical protein PGTUg99_015620 [Puccinia graminis f. sp. tritici]
MKLDKPCRGRLPTGLSQGDVTARTIRRESAQQLAIIPLAYTSRMEEMSTYGGRDVRTSLVVLANRTDGQDDYSRTSHLMGLGAIHKLERLQEA